MKLSKSKIIMVKIYVSDNKFARKCGSWHLKVAMVTYSNTNQVELRNVTRKSTQVCHWLLLVAVLACKQVLFIHSELCLILVIVRSVAAQALRNTLQLCDKLQERPVLDNSFEVRLVLA